MGKHRAQIDRPSNKHWTRKSIALTSSLILIATALGGGVMFAINSLGKNINIIDTSDLNEANRPKGITETDTSPINILIMGSDSREGEGNTGYGEAEGQRSDTTLLVHLYEGRESAIIVSIPRDSYVTIPDCKNNEGNIVTSTTQKFNAAFSIGGPVCTIKTIESLTNVRVDKFVILDFNAFKKVVDALNGVEICLTTPVTDPIRAGGGGTNLDLPAGYSTLNGDQALQFVRARENLGDGSDLSRIDRQQYFIGAMIRDMTKSGLLTNPTLIFEILSAITQSLSTSAEWASLNTLQEFALSIANLKPKNVTMVTTPYQIIENGNVAWSDEATQMWAAIASNRPWPPLTPTATPTPTPTVTPLPAPELVDVYVLNGTSKSGLARTTSNNLETLGFNISDYGNSRERPELTEIRYSAANELKAKSLLSALGQGTLVLDETVLTGVTLIIGKDWSTATPTTVPSPVPTFSPSPTPTPTLTTGTTSASDSGCIDAS